VVLAAGAATFWFAGNRIGVDLSAIASAATVLGIRDSQPHGDGSRATVQRATVRVEGAQQEQAADDQAVGTASFCQAGQSPAFVNGLAELKAQLGDTMGTALECEHPSTAVGDTVQQTTTGLAAYSSRTNTATFTDGWRHWALRDSSLLSWEGTESAPRIQG
jgi:hypothetical protein